MSKPPRRPGDLLLDRYFKDADHETRELAREAFREFARVLEELGEVILAREADSHESQACGRIRPTPPVV